MGGHRRGGMSRGRDERRRGEEVREGCREGRTDERRWRRRLRGEGVVGGCREGLA